LDTQQEEPSAVADAARALELGRLQFAVPARRAGLLRGAPEWLCLYEYGLVHQPPRGAPVAARWAEVEQIRRLDVRQFRSGMSIGMDHQTEIRLLGHHVLWITTRFPEAEAITGYVVERVSIARLPLLAAAIKAGGVVDFGPLSLHVHGISHGGNHLAWPSVSAVGIYKGNVKVVGRGLRGPWASVPAHGLPNLTLLLALARQLRAAPHHHV
jgi:hypothetical protein